MYFCNLCLYQTIHRSKIDIHHLKPIEVGGTNDEFNKVYVCPTCHRLVYVIESKHGGHSIQTEESICIHGWLMSSIGRILHYTKFGEDFFVEDKNK